MKELVLKTSLLKDNEEVATRVRKRLNKTVSINLLGAPGSGKTSILEKIIEDIGHRYNTAVIEGDLYTSKDAERVAKSGVEVVQVNTAGGCHLDASMIEEALNNIGNDNLDFLVIENVGNLVCPASFDLGEDMRVVVVSVTEGNDKPLKYPSMFQKASVIILNKIDLTKFTDFNRKEFYEDIRRLNSNAEIFEVSCRKNYGLDRVRDFLCDVIEKKKNDMSE